MNSYSLIRRFGNQCSIILCLLLIIFLPRVFAGEVYLRQAIKLESQASFQLAALSFEDSANRLRWVKGLYEKAAQSAKLAGEDKNAIFLFETGAKNDGLTPKGWLNLGDLLLKTGDYKAAITSWNEVGDGNPESANALIRLAGAYRSMGDIQKAINTWQELLRIDPQNDKAHYNLGLILMTWQPIEALPELMRSVQINRVWDAQVQVLREGLNLALLQDNLAYQLVVSGQSLASIGEWELAQYAFFHATNIDVDYSEAWAWLGEAYQHTGKNGLPALKKALAINQNSSIILALNGLYYRRQNQIELAWSAYSLAASLEPANPAWQLVLGDISAQNGNLIDALNYYNKAVILAPQDPSVWRGMAEFCIQYDVDISNQGMNASLELLKLAPRDWRSLNIMGQVLMARNDLESARRYFVAAEEISPDQAEIYLHLGYLSLLQNKRDEAYKNLSHAYQLDLKGSIGLQAQRLIDQYFP